jgi:hypothetical protein
MRALAVAALVSLAGLACRGGAPRPSSAPAATLPPIEARPAAADDPIVAKVDGRPVYGSCVAAQAAALHEDKARALDDCIGFELLAGAAAARGVAGDPIVIDGYRRALVGRFLDVEFRDRFRAWDDLPAAFTTPAWDQNAWRMHRPEYRWATYVRAPLAPGASPADEAAARQLIDDIYARVKDRHDLFPDDLIAIADDAAHGRAFDRLRDPYGTAIGGPAHSTFWRPLFQIPAIGSVSPPSRTKWGWDIILWTGVTPPLESTADELRAQMFPVLRREWFEHWIDDLARARNDDIEVHEDQLARLAPPDDAKAAPPPRKAP